MKNIEWIDEANSSESADHLMALATHKSRTVRQAVASNPHANDDTIAILLADKDSSVRLIAATENLATRPKMQLLAACSDDVDVRAAVAATFLEDYQHSLAAEVQQILASDAAPEVRGLVGATTNQPGIFEQLLADPVMSVRAYCASNPRINWTQMSRLVGDSRAEVRTAAAGNGLLLPDEHQLIKLASDRSSAVRWAVLFRVDRPRTALELIARDSNDWNREHAERALRDESLINASAVVKGERLRRKRAELVEQFAEGSTTRDLATENQNC